MIVAVGSVGLEPAYGFKVEGRVFSSAVTIEVAGVPRIEAEVMIREAFAALREAESALSFDSESPTPGAITRLQAAAGSGQKVPLSPEVYQFLSRALDFCQWSGGAHGPLGAPLYELRAWPSAELPGSKKPNLKSVLDAVACRGLSIDRESGSAEIASGSRFDLRGFDHGYAVDRGIEALIASGITNAAIRVGEVIRGMGDGPEGRGWPVEIPLFLGMTQPLSTIYLLDQAAAFISPGPSTNPSARQDRVWLNQRTGDVTQGVVGVVVITEMALDAQGLASVVFILGEHEGRMRIGVIRPQPAILWFLGSGQSEPLLTTHHWTKAVFGN